jgi:hypothetical protein
MSFALLCSISSGALLRGRHRHLFQFLNPLCDWRTLQKVLDGRLLDVPNPNQLLIAAGMGKPTRNELLAEYYLRAGGSTSPRCGSTRRVTSAPRTLASIENEPGRIVYCGGALQPSAFCARASSIAAFRTSRCCERGSHFVLAYRLYEWKKAVIGDRRQARGAGR